MYVYNTTHTHTFKDGKPHAENMTQKKSKTRKTTLPGMSNLLVKHSSGLLKWVSKWQRLSTNPSVAPRRWGCSPKVKNTTLKIYNSADPNEKAGSDPNEKESFLWFSVYNSRDYYVRYQMRG